MIDILKATNDAGDLVFLAGLSRCADKTTDFV